MSAVDLRPPSTLEERTREHWKALLVLLGVTAIGMFTCAPNWNALQSAQSVESFLAELDEPGRALAAAAFDVVFAATYGLLAYAGLRRWGGGSPLAAIASIVVVLGAVFDELENALLVANVLRRAHVSDAWIDAMRVAGTMKWIAGPAVLALYAYLIRAAWRKRGT